MADNQSSASRNGQGDEGRNPMPDLNVEECEVFEESSRRNLLNNPLKLRHVDDGLEGEFDVEEDQKKHEEDQEADKELEYTWSKDEILRYIDQEGDPELGKGFYDGSDFDSLKPKMKQLTDLQGNPIKAYKRLIKPGYGTQIDLNKAVVYHLNGYLEGMLEPMDSTWMRGKPFLHRLNQDPILPGLLHALLTMRVGEKAEILIEPEMAYGPLGCPPRIPENAEILYLVEIVKVYEEGTIANYLSLSQEEQKKVSFDEVMEMCDSERIAGNSYFKDEKYFDAGRRYREAIRLLEYYTFQDEVQHKRAKEVLLKLYCNLANTFLRLNKPVPAMSFAKRALEIDPKHAKGLYFMGKAKFEFGSYDDACKILKQAYSLRPHDTYIAALLEKVNQKKVQDFEREKKLLETMAKGLKM